MVPTDLRRDATPRPRRLTGTSQHAHAMWLPPFQARAPPFPAAAATSTGGEASALGWAIPDGAAASPRTPARDPARRLPDRERLRMRTQGANAPTDESERRLLHHAPGLDSAAEVSFPREEERPGPARGALPGEWERAGVLGVSEASSGWWCVQQREAETDFRADVRSRARWSGGVRAARVGGLVGHVASGCVR
jgi:hypothetical protein